MDEQWNNMEDEREKNTQSWKVRKIKNTRVNITVQREQKEKNKLFHNEKKPERKYVEKKDLSDNFKSDN